MAYVEIKDFKNGLDTRRPAIVGEAGSLRECKNAVISRGGDIESAYYFSPDIVLPPDTFDMHTGNNKLYVFGTVAPPANLAGEVVYQQLVHPSGSTILNVLDAENYDGKVYVIAEFVDGSVYHYYDKTRVTDMDAFAATIADNAAVATYLRDKIDRDAAYISSTDNLDIFITAAVPGVGFSINANTTGTGSLSTTHVQANQAEVAEVRATASFTVTGGFQEANNFITLILADGINDLAIDPVYYVLDNDATALAAATQINEHTADHGYTASSSGATVTIKAPVGLGSVANGTTLQVIVNGLMTVGGVTNFFGGVTAIAAKPQIEKVTVGGSYADANTYTITLDSTAYKITGLSAGYPRVIRTFKTKMHAGIKALLGFSAIDDPTAWTTGTGIGLINISSQNQGSQQLTGLGIYQEFMAIFSRDTVQIWALDPDPTNNTIKQVLPNSGTRSPRAILPFGNSDLIYLDGLRGIRSLKARDIVAAAYVDDIGTKIDTHVAAFLSTLTDSEIEMASGVTDPVNGRAWIAVKNRIYVFSYFPGSKVSAWSYFEPGFDISRMGVANNRIYVRSGDTIYRFGGMDGETHPPRDGAETRIRMPFIDAGRIAGGKKVTGIDVIVQGEWDVYLLLNPRDSEASIEAMTAEMTQVLRVDGSTTLLGRIALLADTTHFAPLLISNHGGKRIFSEVVVHFEDDDTN